MNVNRAGHLLSYIIWARASNGFGFHFCWFFLWLLFQIPTLQLQKAKLVKTSPRPPNIVQLILQIHIITLKQSTGLFKVHPKVTFSIQDTKIFIFQLYPICQGLTGRDYIRDLQKRTRCFCILWQLTLALWKPWMQSPKTSKLITKLKYDIKRELELVWLESTCSIPWNMNIMLKRQNLSYIMDPSTFNSNSTLTSHSHSSAHQTLMALLKRIDHTGQQKSVLGSSPITCCLTLTLGKLQTECFDYISM